MNQNVKNSIVVIFPIEKNNSLRKFAELVLLFDDKKNNREKIITCMNNLGVKCANIRQYNSNKEVVKLIESKKFISCDERTISDFLYNNVKVILYFKAYEESGNRDLFTEEVLCPFVLYRAREINECMLVILPDSTQRNHKLTRNDIQEISNPISRYMYYESLCRQTEWKAKDVTKVNVDQYLANKINIEPAQDMNNFYDQCFIYTGNVGTRLIRNFNERNKNIVNVMPLIKLNHNSYSILNQSVKECFGKEEIFKADWFDYDLYDKIGERFNEFGEKKVNVSRRATKDKYCVINQELYEKHLMTVMIQSICMNSLRTLENSPREEDISTVFGICEHMSLLAFLFFTSYCREIDKSDWTTWESSAVLRLINLAQDYADGILQIIENAKEYADVAYMNYHIINIDAIGRAMLKRRYMKYFNENGEVKFFLQIQIIDLGKSDIVSTFVKNNSIIDGGDKSTQLLLDDFFKPLSENCKKVFRDYYKNVKNVSQHYGLRQFVSMVQSGNGYFEVCSTQRFIAEEKDRYSNCNFMPMGGEHVPGTEYKIFLPIHYAEKAEQKVVGFGAELDYNDVSIEDGWDCELIADDLIVKENKYLERFTNNQLDKTKKIEMLAKYLMKKEMGKKRKILCIDVGIFNQMWQIEILTKAVISYIADSKKIQRIALYNATRSFMMNFTRYLCNFYNNIAGILSSKAIVETQIYVCKDDYSIDLGFKGDSLVDAFVVCDYFARTRGVFNECLELIQSMKRDNKRDGEREYTVKFAPFDLLIDSKDGCLFEKRVANDLEKDIQDVAFGCCLHDSHMKVGSKMHITDNFYDATLLFASGYYTSRLAYLLAKQIASKCQKTEELTLVGYENFSELLLTETRRMLVKLHDIHDVDYLIFEQGVQNEFKFVENDKRRYESRKFIVIVPVGCTLTTHYKIEAEIKNSILQNAQIMLNLTVILIRSKKKREDEENNEKKAKMKASIKKNPREIEDRYWYKIDTDNRVVETKITNPKEVFYNVLISNEWENPLVCSACFPSSDHPELEKPMLTLSYTSVIPMVLIGLKKRYTLYEPGNKAIHQKISELDRYAGSIDMLKECMIYGHVENGSNHFEYYIETELLMKKIYEGKNDNNFPLWIEKLKEVIQAYKRITQAELECEEYIYDILVAPMNRTNATFVEYINMNAFENVPIIVYIDANREFRDNIKTKYSNLTALYYNLMLSNKKAVINFHYIDDCIISGTTFYRTKSLLQSLFPVQAFSKDNAVYVDIFQNVILLLNRCSNSTKLNYAHADHFFSYIDVHISSMRTHHDKACVLCENESHYRLLRDCSSTNNMAEEWNRKFIKNAVKPIDKSKEIYANDPETPRMRDRHFRRLYCANLLSDKLDQLGDEKNNTIKVKEQILYIINQSLLNIEEPTALLHNLELIISYFKVAARPFLVFRKSVLEAVFAILITILENWGNTNREEFGNISKTINRSIACVTNGKYDKELIRCLESLYRSIISLLSSLGSKYLVRKDSYCKLMRNDPIMLIESTERVQLEITPFYLFYAANIKRMITLNKDETIGLWFENLLVNGYEFQEKGHIKRDEDFIKMYGIESDFGKILFLENTYIIFQTVLLIYGKVQGPFLEEKIDDIMCNFDKAYYYENYRNLLQNENDKIDNYSRLKDETKKMVILFAHLKENVENERNVVDYYKKLADKMGNVSGAETVLIYGCSQFDKKTDVYEIARRTKTGDKFDYRDIIINMSEDRGVEISDTLQKNLNVCIEENYIVVKIDNNSEWDDEKSSEQQEYDYSDNIYCIFKYVNLAKMTNYEVLRRIRNILVFRHTMMERFRDDFHNNAFKVFMEQKHRNELIASMKAVSHTSNETIKYVTQEVGYVEKNDLNIFSAYTLQLAADSLVSRLYVEKIQGNIQDVMRVMTSFELTDQMLCVLGNLRRYSDGDTISNGTYTGLVLQNKINSPIKWEVVKGEQHYRILFITAILYNALQHGLADCDSRKIKVDIFQEAKEGTNYLYFKNMTRYPNVDVFTDSIESGITIKALEYYFEQYLGRQIDRGPIQEKNGISYKIGLPVSDERRV